jgi:hypothetical protein
LFHKRNRTRDPRVPEPKRSPLAIFNAACPFSSEFLVKVTFVSTRPGILRSRRILNHAKPSITAGGMKKWFLLQNIKDSSLNLTFVMVFSITENGDTALLSVSKFNLKRVYATKNTSMHPEHLNV